MDGWMDWILLRSLVQLEHLAVLITKIQCNDAERRRRQFFQISGSAFCRSWGISGLFWFILNYFLDNKSSRNKCLSSIGFCGNDCEPSCPYLIDRSRQIFTVLQCHLVSILVCPLKLNPRFGVRQPCLST